MGRPRKLRSDSNSSAVNAVYNLQNNVNGIFWPKLIPSALNETVRELELSAFESILSTRNPTQWKPMEILTVARMAGHLAQQVKDEDALKRSGTLIRSPNNDKQFIRNPLLDAISTRQAVLNQLSRQLGVSLPGEASAVEQDKFSRSGADNVFSLLAR